MKLSERTQKNKVSEYIVWLMYIMHCQWQSWAHRYFPEVKSEFRCRFYVILKEANIEHGTLVIGLLNR